MLVSTSQASEALCGVAMGDVATAIEAGTYYGRKADSNESSLEVKLVAAETKLTYYKFEDAVDKLYDISEKATAWADAPKSKLDDATAINYAVADAISCIGSL
jgi:hypothetical protein